MRKNFLEPEMNVVCFTPDDVITNSIPVEPDLDNGQEWD